jgi:hypothetical protein
MRKLDAKRKEDFLNLYSGDQLKPLFYESENDSNDSIISIGNKSSKSNSNKSSNSRKSYSNDFESDKSINTHYSSDFESDSEITKNSKKSNKLKKTPIQPERIDYDFTTDYEADSENDSNKSKKQLKLTRLKKKQNTLLENVGSTAKENDAALNKFSKPKLFPTSQKLTVATEEEVLPIRSQKSQEKPKAGFSQAKNIQNNLSSVMEEEMKSNPENQQLTNYLGGEEQVIERVQDVLKDIVLKIENEDLKSKFIKFWNKSNLRLAFNQLYTNYQIKENASIEERKKTFMDRFKQAAMKILQSKQDIKNVTIRQTDKQKQAERVLERQEKARVSFLKRQEEANDSVKKSAVALQKSRLEQKIKDNPTVIPSPDAKTTQVLLKPLRAGGGRRRSATKESLGSARLSSATDAEDMTPFKAEEKTLKRRGKKPNIKTNTPGF